MHSQGLELPHGTLVVGADLQGGVLAPGIDDPDRALVADTHAFTVSRQREDHAVLLEIVARKLDDVVVAEAPFCLGGFCVQCVSAMDCTNDGDQCFAGACEPCECPQGQRCSRS